MSEYLESHHEQYLDDLSLEYANFFSLLSKHDGGKLRARLLEITQDEKLTGQKVSAYWHILLDYLHEEEDLFIASLTTSEIEYYFNGFEKAQEILSTINANRLNPRTHQLNGLRRLSEIIARVSREYKKSHLTESQDATLASEQSNREFYIFFLFMLIIALGTVGAEAGIHTQGLLSRF